MSRILIVDDKDENLYYLSALLGGHGFATETARHGAEALVMARQNPPDLVVSDLLMPVMDGYTLLRHWKSDPRLKLIPFVVYTATYTEAADERLAMNLGADAFVLKPAEPDVFVSRIREVLANAASAAPTPPRNQTGDEKELLKTYSETLIRKLEEKTLQLQEANRALQRDITERSVAEEKLRESEERFRATFEQAAVGIAHVGVDGTFLRVNDKLCEITGYSRAELLQKTYVELTVPEDRAEGDSARRAMLAGTQAAYAAEKRYQRKDGRVVWVSIVTTPLRDSAGQPKYFISVFSDVTERKVLQEQFLRAQRMDSIGTLAGGIAHDLNNILAPITMGVSLLKLSTSDPKSTQIFDTIERSARRGANLVKQVLSFARGIEGSRVTIHLSHLIREIQDIVQSTFPKNIHFAASVPKDIWTVQGDPTQLNQVLLNLCVNARDAMPQGGSLRITARNIKIDEQYASMLRTVPPGRYVVIETSDTGCGISSEIRDRIFEPFFTTKPVGKGTGLGLSTALTIVRSHGGAVQLDSEPGHGSTFSIYLPVQTELSTGPADEIAAPPPPRGHGELVLIVDDDDAVLGMTQQTLETFGYRVLRATDGAQATALFALHRTEIAVVLLDMMMPVMDGPALVQALRHIAPTVKIIASSGQQGNDDPASIAGVKQFLSKPYSGEALLTAIAQVIAG